MSSSKQYVLAEYNNQTRKLQGDWANDTYPNLIKAVRVKFNIVHEMQIEIKVYDKHNNKFFTIDEDDMVEIQPAGSIKITKSRNQTKTKPVPQTLNQEEEEEEDAIRRKWKVNSKVEVYSNTMKKWIKGTISRIVNDEEGEWLRIQYLKNREKEIQRFSKYIRPTVQATKPAAVSPVEIVPQQKEEKADVAQEDTVVVGKENVNSGKENVKQAINEETAEKTPEIEQKEEPEQHKKNVEPEKKVEVECEGKTKDDAAKNEETADSIIQKVESGAGAAAEFEAGIAGKNPIYIKCSRCSLYNATSSARCVACFQLLQMFPCKRGPHEIVNEKIVPNVQKPSYRSYASTYAAKYPWYARQQRDFQRKRKAQYAAACYAKQYYEGILPPLPPSYRYYGPIRVRANYGNVFGGGGNYNICWEFNTAVGCPRGAFCQWIHQYVVK